MARGRRRRSAARRCWCDFEISAGRGRDDERAARAEEGLALEEREGRRDAGESATSEAMGSQPVVVGKRWIRERPEAPVDTAAGRICGAKRMRGITSSRAPLPFL